MSADIGFHVITEIVKPIHKSIEKKLIKQTRSWNVKSLNNEYFSNGKAYFSRSC